jgi:AraC family transcriptional regulator
MSRELRRCELRDFVVREVVYAPGVRMARHTHEFSNVTVVVGGQIDELGPAGHHRGRAGSVVLKPAGCEHENGVSGHGARTLTIELRHGAIASEVARRAWSWFEQASVVKAAVALCRANDREVEAAALNLVATVLATPHCGTAEPQVRASAPPWLPRIIDALQQRFDEPLRLESLARDLGLHPVYVSRAFRQHVGVTMHDYLRGLRLRHARHLLSSSRRSVTAIAAEAGFSDPSHLSRTFAELLGVTPRSFRDLSGLVQGVQVGTRKGH